MTVTLPCFRGGNVMGWLDNIIAAFSPESAYKREAYRQAYRSLKDSYDAGSHSGINQNWRVPNASAEFTDRYEIGRAHV